jgi:hypothetical protein
VEPFQVRWTQDDLEPDKTGRDLPRRFTDALEKCDVERAPLVRTLIRKWVKEVERLGCEDPVMTAVVRATTAEHPPTSRVKLNEPSPKYGAKKGGKKKAG